MKQSFMSEANFHTFIKSVLRKASLRWPPLNKVRSSARVERGWYRCAGCGNLVPTTIMATLKNGKQKRVKNVVVDHIHPVVPVEGFNTWDEVIERMFCDEAGLQVLCKACHDEKCSKENHERKSRRTGV